MVLSHSSIHKARISQREVICQEAKEEFWKKMPQLLVLHWDGALIRDISNDQHEMESILVSGPPHYIEGKIIGTLLNTVYYLI